MKLPFNATLLALRAIALAMFVTAAAFGQSPANGTIEGRVINETNGNYLNNARVTLDGTTR